MLYIKKLEKIKEDNLDQPEYLQALDELMNSLLKVIDTEEVDELNLIPRLFIPNKIISFKVEWLDDNGQIQVNQGYRVQHSNLLGPFKGGIRFNKTVNLSVMKFLALEQTFKNSLTGLPLGGAKGGSDFDPYGKSEGEIERFCQAFMAELHSHIGAKTDVPAGDLGVGEREIGHLYKQFVRLKGEEKGVFTGKPIALGGSLIRKEATGFGVLYFTKRMFESHNLTLIGKRAIISGTGNVGSFALKKAIELGIKIVGVSNYFGVLIDEDGINYDNVVEILKNNDSLENYVNVFKRGTFHLGSIYDLDIECDMAIPCATQNEINLERAKRLVRNGCLAVVEGANMPTDNQAIEYLLANNILFGPAKAANAGGVSVSYFEMVQNDLNEVWSAEEVDAKLLATMNNIHDNAQKMSLEYLGNPSNYLFGANVFGFKRLLDAIRQKGK